MYSVAGLINWMLGLLDIFISVICCLRFDNGQFSSAIISFIMKICGIMPHALQN